MHHAKPQNFRVGERECARKKRTKPDIAHECRQMRTQLLTDERGRPVFCFGRFVSTRLISNETFGKIPHLWSGSAHLETPSDGALFRQTSCLRPTTKGRLQCAPVLWRCSPAREQIPRTLPQPHCADRKSTRLNSS